MASSRLKLARLAWVLVALWSGVSVAAWVARDPGMYSDPAWGILAAAQWLSGASSGLRMTRQADPDDLTSSFEGRVSAWPPSYQALPALFHAAGCDWGWSLRWTVALASLAAAVGWGLYFRRLVAPNVLPWLVLAFLMARFSHANFDLYDGGELLLRAAFPWVALWTLHALRREDGPGSLGAAAVAGAAGAALVLVKFSAVLVMIGVGAAWLWRARAGALSWGRVVAYAGGAGLVSIAIRAAEIPGGGTAASLVGSDSSPHLLLAFYALLAYAPTDLGSLASYALLHPDRALGHAEAWFVFVGALLTLATVWLTRRLARNHAGAFTHVSHEVQLAVACVLVTPALYGSFAATGAPVGLDPRYLRMPALLVLPIAVDLLARRIEPRTTAILARATLGVLLVLPAVYGAVTLVDKGFRRAPRDRALSAAHGVRLDVLGEGGDAEAFGREVEAAVPNAAVLYVPTPDLALGFAARRLVVSHADFEPLASLASRRYRGCPADGVAVLLPRTLDASGKREAILASFDDVEAWHRRPLAAAPTWDLWRGRCDGP